MAQLVYEGPTLEDVITRILVEAGPEVKVAKAERVRRGGIAGFFAREHFEITLADEVPSGSAGDGGTAHDLASAILALREGRNSEPLPLDSLVETTTDSLEISSTRNKPASESTHAPASSDEPGDGASLVPKGQKKRSFSSVLDRLMRSTGANDMEDDPPDEDDAIEVGATSTELVPQPSPSIDTVASQASQRCHVALQTLGLPPSLLPELLGDAESDRDLSEAILGSLRSLPPPPAPPRCVGSLLAVIGDPERAPEVASDIAASLGLDPDDVPLASPVPPRKRVPARLLVRNAEAAAERAPEWRRRAHPTVVAMVAPVNAAHRAWARHVLGALKPTSSWGVVDATVKTGDVLAWSDALGGLDALVLVGTENTTTPADILGAGIPVARIDGHSATCEQWTALLTSRMAELVH